MTERRFLTGFRSADADTPGLVQEDDGTVWLVAADGTRTQISGGGSSAPVNWCVVTLATPAALTVGSPAHSYAAGDMTIASQSGSDFSIGTAPIRGGGAVLTAAGGRFQCAAYLGNPANATLDGGSARPRWLWCGAISGSDADATNPFDSAGFDQTVPVDVNDSGFIIAALAASTIGYSNPGDPAAFGLVVRAVSLTGTDSVPLDDSGPFQLLVWQV